MYIWALEKTLPSPWQSFIQDFKYVGEGEENLNKIVDIEGMYKICPHWGGSGEVFSPKKFLRNEPSEVESEAFWSYFYTFQGTTSTEILDYEQVIYLYSSVILDIHMVDHQRRGGGIWPTRTF